MKSYSKKIFLLSLVTINSLLVIFLMQKNYQVSAFNSELAQYKQWLFEYTIVHENVHVISSDAEETEVKFWNNDDFITVFRFERKHCNSCVVTSFKIIDKLLKDSLTTKNMILSTDYSDDELNKKIKNFDLNQFHSCKLFLKELKDSKTPYFFRIRKSDFKVTNIVLSEWDKEDLSEFCVEKFLN